MNKKEKRRTLLNTDEKKYTENKFMSILTTALFDFSRAVNFIASRKHRKLFLINFILYSDVTFRLKRIETSTLFHMKSFIFSFLLLIYRK